MKGKVNWFVGEDLSVRKGCIVQTEIHGDKVFDTEKEALEYSIATSEDLEIKFKDKIESLRTLRFEHNKRWRKNQRGQYLRMTLEMFEYFYDNPDVQGMERWPGWKKYKHVRNGPCPVCYFSIGRLNPAEALCYGRCLVPIFAKERGCQENTGVLRRWAHTENTTVRKELGRKIILSIRNELNSNYDE